MFLSDELIVGIATCVTTILVTVFTILANKLRPIDKERYEKILFPIMRILQSEDFRFRNIETSSAAVIKIKNILQDIYLNLIMPPVSNRNGNHSVFFVNTY